MPRCSLRRLRPRAARPRPAARPLVRARRGMTLVEVLVALGILAVALVGLTEYIARFARTVNQEVLRATAADLVVSRLESVKGVTRYDSLGVLAGTETSIPNYPAYHRVTAVVRRTSTTTDHQVITVFVTHPGMPGDTVRKTTMIARF